MSEKQQVVNIYLGNRLPNEFHFLFENDPEKHDGKSPEDGLWKRDKKSLEEFLEQITDSLRGRKWIARMQEDLVVIGETSQHQYILNKPTEWAMQRLAADYGGCRLTQKDVNRDRLRRVTVRNMRVPGRESILLEAYVGFTQSRHGYCQLIPTYMSLNTSELDAVMTEMMKLKMLKIGNSKDLKWLRRACGSMVCVKR